MQGFKKERVENDEDGEYWRCTAIEPATRLRVGRGIGQTETRAAINLWQQVKQRDAHADSPPPCAVGWMGWTSGGISRSLRQSSRLHGAWTTAYAQTTCRWMALYLNG
jgi:hypothetical protein